MKKALLTLVLLIITGVVVYGQTPEKINYQAVARSSGGAILNNQNVSLQISILETSSSGNIVYSEIHTLITNQYGLINFEIGSGTPVSGSFSGINWGADDHFLQVELDETGGSNYQLMGTSQLISVPYALHAKTVELETQDLTLTGTDLAISNGSTVDLSGIDTDTQLNEAQVDTYVSNNGYITNPDDADADPNNEIQSLNLVGNDLTISGGNTVTLPSGGGADNWGTDVVNSDATLFGDGTVGNPLSVSGDLTDDQNLTLVGTRFNNRQWKCS